VTLITFCCALRRDRMAGLTGRQSVVELLFCMFRDT